MGTTLSNNLEALFSKMEGFVSTETVVGQPVNINGVIIVPLVDVSFGLAAGGSENAAEEKAKSGGSGGGLGAKITPSAVLVIINGTVQLVNVKNQDSVGKLIDMVPGVLSKFNIDVADLFGKKDKDKKDKTKYAEAVMPSEAESSETGE